MKVVTALICALSLSGCCYNQYERNGYSLGFDCLTPSERTTKECNTGDANISCDEKVEKVKESIEARSNN